jgi:hypothetical protein
MADVPNRTRRSCASSMRPAPPKRLIVSVSFIRNGPAAVSRHVLKGTAQIARTRQTEVVANETRTQSLSDMKPGDVLVSHSSAVREHDISVIPNAPHATSATHDAAVRDGCSEADAMRVDAWLTEDKTHVVKIASHRLRDK